MDAPHIAIAADGALTLTAGGMTLAGIYPAIDGTPIRPQHVTVSPEQVTWTLSSARTLTLTISRQQDRVRLGLRLTGLVQAPGRIDLLHGGSVAGGLKAWCMAQGMGGGARCIDLPHSTEQRSSSCTAVRADDGSSLGFWATDHRRFTCSAYWQGSTLRFGFDTECIPLPDGTLELPELIIAHGADFWSMLTAMCDEIGTAGGVIPRARQRTWCSWYYHYHHFSRADLDATLLGLNSLPDRGGVTTVQIDAGYCTSLGDWLEPNHLWPGGLQSAFQAIRDAGFTPGIWIGPFMVGSRSRLARQHPDWLLRHRDGTLVTPIRNYGEHRLWHYPDEEYYSLDTSHPDAFAALRSIFKTLVGWGAGYVKTDFLYWGFQDSREVLRTTPGRTSVEYVRDVMSMIRNELGQERYLLGCIAPYMPCLGLVDGMRIAGDIGPQWSGGFDPQNMLDESLHAQPVDGRWFQSDPDALLVRDFHSGFKQHEVEALALWQAMTGGNLCTSDPLHRCAADRLLLWRFCDSSQAPHAAVIPDYGNSRTERLAVRDLGGNRWALLALNATDRPLHVSLPVARLIPRQSTIAHPWGPGATGEPGPVETLTADLPAHTARLWLLADQVQARLPATLSGRPAAQVAAAGA